MSLMRVKLFSNMGENTLLQKGRQAMASGRLGQAEECFRGHLAFHPESAEAYLAISVCLMSAGQYVAAQHDLRAAIHVLPENVAIAVALGQALYSTGDYAAGRQVYEWAMQYQTDFVVQASYLLNRFTDPQDEGRVLEHVYREAVAAVLRDSTLSGDSHRPSFSVSPRAPDRALKIGYLVSGQKDFMENWGLANIIAAHNPVNVQVIGFGEGVLSDSGTAFFSIAFRPGAISEEWIL